MPRVIRLLKCADLEARLQRPSNPVPRLIVYDRILAEKSASFRKFVKKFDLAVAVDSGEELKSLHSFASFVEKLPADLFLWSRKSMEVWAVGGGSVGDFVGFFASIWKRGVKLVMVPSTWLSAVDSAHGGKTGLNLHGAKNQLGTFYPATSVYLVRELLEYQGPERLNDAMGEVAKIALIDGGAWVKQLRNWAALDESRRMSLFWKILPAAIESKMKWVKKDPLESRGDREVLNLGHTIGHLLELEVPLSHGVAVAQGLLFALDLSQQQAVLSRKEHERLTALLEKDCGITRQFYSSAEKLSRVRAEKLLKQDKKLNPNGEMSFVLLRRMGSPVRVSLPVRKILSELERGGWVE